MEILGTQLRRVLRRLGRAPMFTAVTLITLAAGVGANIAVFSVVESVLLKPLPYPHPEQLVGVWHSSPQLNIPLMNMSPSNYFIYREQNRVFQDIGVYQGDSVNVTGQGNPEQVRALDVTEGVLPILGVPPMLGRWFNRADATPGAPDTVMLDYGYWRRRFNGDRGVVGRSITVDGKPRQVIGVMPQSFRFLDWEQPEMIFPYQFDRSKTLLGQFSFEGIARLRPGVTLEQANADEARMMPIVLDSFPPPSGFSVEMFKQIKVLPNVRPLRLDVVGDVGKLLWVLMGSIGVVLLIACANVANLMLVRAEGRHQELAVCSALGASRYRIVGEFLLESLVIGVAGSLLGLAFAWGALRLLIALSPSGLPRLHDIGIDLPVLGFTVAIALLCSLLFGSIPALRYAGARMSTGMREGGRTLSQGRERHRTRNLLVVMQVSLALVLLICSGLMIRTFRALTHVTPGYNPAGVQTLELTIPEAAVPDADRVVRMEEAMMRQIAAIPGVTSVGMTHSLPMSGDNWQDPVSAQDRPSAPGSIPPLRSFKFVSPNYFKTIGTPLIAGRDFTWDETFGKRPVAIVSENLAREYWGDAANALGKQVHVGASDEWRQVVGVVGDVHDEGTSKDAPSIAYWPLYVNHFEGGDTQIRRTLTFAIRSPRAGSESLMKEVRQAIWTVDADLPLSKVRTLEYYYNKSMARTSFTLIVLGIAASMALLLGIVGLYGVLAYSVSQRTREVGIRIALGAQRNQVVGMFVRHGLMLAGAGIACGLAISLVATRLLASLLFHVRPADPLTYGAACVALALAAALASYLPSRRTTAVNPVEALRAE